jgi:hypothetical protein
MNPALLNALADQHISELRQRAAAHRTAPDHREPRRADGGGRQPRLRSHLGFALVAAGFHLLETDSSRPAAEQRG